MSKSIGWAVALVDDGEVIEELEGRVRLSDVSANTPGEVFAMCATMVAEQIREALLSEAKKE